jgi:hypothetical protein
LTTTKLSNGILRNVNIMLSFLQLMHLGVVACLREPCSIQHSGHRLEFEEWAKRDGHMFEMIEFLKKDMYDLWKNHHLLDLFQLDLRRYGLHVFMVRCEHCMDMFLMTWK